MLTRNQFRNLHQAARPANNGQSDFVPLLLQHGDERGVAHAHRREAVHRHDHVPTPGQGQADRNRNRNRLSLFARIKTLP